MPTGEMLVPLAGAVRSPGALYRKLSPGPGMAPDEVASHQRARIYAAMIDIVGKEGYNSVTVRRLAQLAGVSTRTFYAHFASKEECFLCTYAAVTQGAARRITDAQTGAAGWLEQMEWAFEVFGREIEERPQAARLALVGVFAAGSTASEQMRSTEGLFEAMIADSLGRASGGFEAPSLLAKGIVGGISCSARSHLLADDEKELPGLASDLFEWTLSFLRETVVEQVELHLSATSELAAVDERRIQEGKGTPEEERELILSAVAKLVFAEGYRQLTVPRICAAAGIRRKRFEAHFEGVTDCFLAVLKLRALQAFEYAATQATVGNSWSEDVNLVIKALCEQVARDPVFAKLVFIEAFVAGEEGVFCREEIKAVIAEHFLARVPTEQRPTRLAAETSVGAVWSLLHHYVISGGVQQLPRLVPTLSLLMLAPTIGSLAAVKPIRRDTAA